MEKMNSTMDLARKFTDYDLISSLLYSELEESDMNFFINKFLEESINKDGFCFTLCTIAIDSHFKKYGMIDKSDVIRSLSGSMFLVNDLNSESIESYIYLSKKSISYFYLNGYLGNYHYDFSGTAMYLHDYIKKPFEKSDALKPHPDFIFSDKEVKIEYEGDTMIQPDGLLPFAYSEYPETVSYLVTCGKEKGKVILLEDSDYFIPTDQFFCDFLRSEMKYIYEHLTKQFPDVCFPEITYDYVE